MDQLIVFNCIMTAKVNLQVRGGNVGQNHHPKPVKIIYVSIAHNVMHCAVPLTSQEIKFSKGDNMQFYNIVLHTVIMKPPTVTTSYMTIFSIQCVFLRYSTTCNGACDPKGDNPYRCAPKYKRRYLRGLSKAEVTLQPTIKL